MALIDTGLTDSGSGRGKTTHYAFTYDDALDSTAHPGQPEPARTNALIAACENDYNLMSGWFGGINLPYALPVSVQVANAGGGAGWGPPITLRPGGGDANLMRFLMVAEVTEMFMLSQNRGWFAPDGSNEQSSGEGLSHFLATQFLFANSLGLFNNISNLWMNSSREDFVNHVDEYDHSSGPKSACALLFLYYLNVQLGFTIPQIVAAASAQLSGVYRNLTGDSGDPFPFFKQLLDVAFPGTATITAGPNLDNPYPLGLLSFWVDKSTFGRDEVQDAINTSGGAFRDAFWLVAEGFSADSFGALGVAISALTGSFTAIPGVTIARSTTPIDFEDPGNPKVPQRIRIAYDITFTAASVAAFPAAGTHTPDEKVLRASLTAGGATLGGSDAVAVFELVPGADPYFTNIDPAQNNVFWLSQDIRVFTAVPGQNAVTVAGGPAFGSDSVAGAFSYVQQLLAHLNSTYSNPAGTDPFATVLPSQAAALTADSSVTPFTFDFSNIFNPHVYANYNFAIARVRLRGTAGPAGAAQNVRVFFRLWSTQSADTDYQPSSTYPSTSDAAGLPSSPLVGTDHHTIPFFATGNLVGNTDYDVGGINNQTVQITSGDSVWVYFGCFLNIYDAANVIDGQPVQHWLNGTHHCIVAQIAYDDGPIVNSNGVTMNPENSDKLAQRNLQVTHSDNPGPAATHRVPQTFDARPSPALQQLPGSLLDLPDELMIDWGEVPAGSTATIYWPQVSAAEVVRLAESSYGSHLLAAADAHTIRLEVTKGVTYVPIPPRSGDNFAGLFTVDLPPTVARGQEFDIVVRRIATRRFTEIERPALREQPVVTDFIVPHEGETPGIELNEAPPAAAPPADGQRPANWRYVVGTFQVKIPVATEDALLFPEENTLAIIKWRLNSLPTASRWRPVLERYVEQIAARVDGLGGDANAVEPSPLGVPAWTRYGLARNWALLLAILVAACLVSEAIIARYILDVKLDFVSQFAAFWVYLGWLLTGRRDRKSVIITALLCVVLTAAVLVAYGL